MMTTLNRNNSNWSFEERRKINENWDILEGLANSTASGNNGLKSEVDQLKITVGQNTNKITNSLQLSNQANIKSDSALTSANTALSNSNEAKNLALGVDQKANQAVSTSATAETKSDNAIDIANAAKNTSENVQEQFNQVVAEAGSNNPEVVASRVDAETGETFVSLPQRLDQQHNQVTQRLEQVADWVSNATSQVMFVAHRGYSQYYPENTLLAYQEADKVSFGGWELDPWYLPLSDTWVNIHDTTVDRTTDGTGNVTAFDLANIRNLKIDGGNNANLYKALKVPTAEEIFRLATKSKSNPYLFLDTRTVTAPGTDTTRSLGELIKKYKYEEKTFIVLGADLYVRGIRAELPNVGIAYTFTNNVPTASQLDVVRGYGNSIVFLDSAVLTGESGQNVIDLCLERNLPVAAYTVNSSTLAARLINMGVKIIVTDSIAKI